MNFLLLNQGGNLLLEQTGALLLETGIDCGLLLEQGGILLLNEGGGLLLEDCTPPSPPGTTITMYWWNRKLHSRM